MRHHHPRYLLTLFAVPLLTLGQGGNAIGTLSPNVKAQLETLKQEALEELPVSAGYRTEYDLWKYNKSFIGAWRQGDRIFLSFLLDGVDYQLIESSINDAKAIFKEKNVGIDLAEQGLSWGEATAIQNAIFRASNLNLIPEVFSAGVDPKTGALRVGVNSEDDIEVVTDALQAMGVDQGLVQFRFDRLQDR